MSESHKTGAFQYHQRRPLGPIYGGCSDVVFQLPTSNFEHTTMISGCVWRTVFLFKFSLCIFVNCGLEKFRYHISWLWVILNVFFLKKQPSLRQYKLELPIFLLSTFGNWLIHLWKLTETQFQYSLAVLQIFGSGCCTVLYLLVTDILMRSAYLISWCNPTVKSSFLPTSFSSESLGCPIVFIFNFIIFSNNF